MKIKSIFTGLFFLRNFFRCVLRLFWFHNGNCIMWWPFWWFRSIFLLFLDYLLFFNTFLRFLIGFWLIFLLLTFLYFFLFYQLVLNVNELPWLNWQFVWYLFTWHLTFWYFDNSSSLFCSVSRFWECQLRMRLHLGLSHHLASQNVVFVQPWWTIIFIKTTDVIAFVLQKSDFLS